MKHLSLFSGIGGFDLAAEWMGWENVAQVEIDPFCLKVLEKNFPNTPKYGDVKGISFVDENDGLYILESCCQKENCGQTEKILKERFWPLRSRKSLKTVDIAEHENLSSLTRPNDNVNIVHKNVDTKPCEEMPLQMQIGEHGWSDQIIPIGKMEKGGNATIDIKTALSLNGEGEFLQEIDIPAKAAATVQKEKDSSMPITLSSGQNVLNEDSILLTDEHYASHVTKKFIGKIDIITAGFPCQPFSQAGARRGTQDDRFLWPEVVRIIRETHPTYCLLENVRGLLTIEDGLVFEQVCVDLESIGYGVQPIVIPACAVNAPHRRDRIWFIANARFGGQAVSQEQTARSEQYSQDAADPKSEGLARECRRKSQHSRCPRYNTRPSWGKDWPEVAAELCSLDDGLSVELGEFKRSKAGHRNEQLKAYGNAIVPQVAYEIFKAIPAPSAAE